MALNNALPLTAEMQATPLLGVSMEGQLCRRLQAVLTAADMTCNTTVRRQALYKEWQRQEPHNSFSLPAAFSRPTPLPPPPKQDQLNFSRAKWLAPPLLQLAPDSATFTSSLKATSTFTLTKAASNSIIQRFCGTVDKRCFSFITKNLLSIYIYIHTNKQTHPSTHII